MSLVRIVERNNITINILHLLRQPFRFIAIIENNLRMDADVPPEFECRFPSNDSLQHQQKCNKPRQQAIWQ
jgi:hypothetical protein